MNGKAKNAWDVYLSAENQLNSYSFLLILANDCYKMGQFYYSLKAFEELEKQDGENDYEDAIRGSVIGIFQMVIAGNESV
jgi:intraflagellar transport protein 56